MKVYRRGARKHSVNLTLNEDLVHEAKAMAENLSGLVEALLFEFVAQQRKQRLGKLGRTKALKATVQMWNEFNAKSGSIADEFVTL